MHSLNKCLDTLYKLRYEILLLVYTILALFFCSSSSPLYVINDWTDANTYFTMGKGIVHGMVPYRDLFDHKGPLLYFIYAVGYLMSPTSFIGVFVLQIISMYIALLFLYKTARLLLDSSPRAFFSSILVTFFILGAGVYYLPEQLDMGGGSPEEFTLPFLTVSLYLITRDAKRKTVSRFGLFVIGILMGSVCLIKFNLAVFWVGLLVPVFLSLLFQKKVRLFFQAAACMVLGILVVALPYLAYALATDSLSSFIEAYISFNKLYSFNEHSLSVRIMQSLGRAQNFLFSSFIIGFTFIGGFLYVLFFLKSYSLAYRASICMSFLALILIVFYGKAYAYSHLPFLIFAVFGFVALFRLFPESTLPKAMNRLKPCLPALLAACILLVVVNNSRMFITKDKNKPGRTITTCQSEVAALVRSGPEEKPTLLELDMLSRGFYTVLDIVPPRKYFYKPNIPYEDYPDVLDSQLAYVQEKAADYVVFFAGKEPVNATPLRSDTPRDRILSAVLDGYSLVGIVEGTGSVDGGYFHVYHKQ